MKSDPKCTKYNLHWNIEELREAGYEKQQLDM